MNIANHLEKNATDHPNKTALIFEGKEMSFKQLSEMSNQLGNGLKSLGVGKGDIVSVLLPNSIDFVVCYWGIIKIGAAIHPISTMFSPEEAKYVINNAGCQVLVTAPNSLNIIEAIWTDCPNLKSLIVISNSSIPGTISFNELVSDSSSDLQPVDCEENDIANLYYTAGTTGRPKGVILTHGSYTANQKFFKDHWKVTMKDKVLNVLPFFHAYGVIMPLLISSFNGCTLTILERWDTEKVLKTIEEQKITCFFGVPTMFVYIVRLKRFETFDLTSLRVCIVGGAPMPEEVHREFVGRAKLMPGVFLYEGYGTTGNSVTMQPFGKLPRFGSCGVAVPYPCEVKIVDDSGKELPPGEIGEIIFRGPNIPIGFWRMPAKTMQDYRDGFLHSGDLGKKDKDGYFYIVDRKDDLIITSGYNVYPKEVEEVLYKHPKVSEAAVVGLKDLVRGEIVKAFVVLKDGEKAGQEELIEYCKNNLAHYKAPRSVDFLDDLPKSGAGKILRRELKKRN